MIKLRKITATTHNNASSSSSSSWKMRGIQHKFGTIYFQHGDYNML
jgi:hypothetical protein